MNVDPMKVLEVAAVAFLFYVHMTIIARRLDKLTDAVYTLAGQKPKSDTWRKAE